MYVCRAERKEEPLGRQGLGGERGGGGSGAEGARAGVGEESWREVKEIAWQVGGAELEKEEEERRGQERSGKTGREEESLLPEKPYCNSEGAGADERGGGAAHAAGASSCELRPRVTRSEAEGIAPRPCHHAATESQRTVQLIASPQKACVAAQESAKESHSKCRASA